MVAVLCPNQLATAGNSEIVLPVAWSVALGCRLVLRDHHSATWSTAESQKLALLAENTPHSLCTCLC